MMPEHFRGITAILGKLLTKWHGDGFVWGSRQKYLHAHKHSHRNFT